MKVKEERNKGMSAEGGSFVQPAIPRFDGHYLTMLTENFLRLKEHWNLVEVGTPVAAARVEQSEA